MIIFLFYSTKCKHSANLINIINSQKLSELFRPICIDTMKIEDLIRQGINNVPTIMVINQNGTESRKDIYDGANAFNWIEQFINNRREFMMRQAEETRKIIQINNQKLYDDNKALKGYYTMETSGLSDAYAYYSKDISKDVDIAQPKTFLPYGKDQEYSIVTLNDGGMRKTGDIERVKKEETIKEDNMKKSRQNQDLELKKMMEQQQISAVVNAQFNI